MSCQNIRERLIVKLAILSGMRPGEIFGMKWEAVKVDHIDVKRGVYRGDIDSPKNKHSVRRAALSDDLVAELNEWRSLCQFTGDGDWVFASENRPTSVSRDNAWRRWIKPKLSKFGLGWASFQVMRRTHSSLMHELEVDPKIVADRLGHTLDVNQNVYTKVALRRRIVAVNALEKALRKP